MRKNLFFSLKSNKQCSIIHGFSHNRLVNKNLMNNKTPDLTRSEVKSKLDFELNFKQLIIKFRFCSLFFCNFVAWWLKNISN